MTQVIIQNKKGLGVVRESNDYQYTRDAHLHQNTAGDTAYIFCSHINVTTTGKYESTERVFMQCLFTIFVGDYYVHWCGTLQHVLHESFVSTYHIFCTGNPMFCHAQLTCKVRNVFL